MAYSSADGGDDAADSGSRHFRGDRLFNFGQGEYQERIFEVLCSSMDHTGCISSVLWVSHCAFDL